MLLCYCILFYYSIYSIHCIVVYAPGLSRYVCIYVEYVCFSGGYVVLCARASKESGEWQYFSFVLILGVGIGRERGRHQRDRLGRRGEKNQNNIPFFLSLSHRCAA